jgi:hypothetical protein
MELRRGAPCVRPHFWHRYEVTVVREASMDV